MNNINKCILNGRRGPKYQPDKKKVHTFFKLFRTTPSFAIPPHYVTHIWACDLSKIISKLNTDLRSNLEQGTITLFFHLNNAHTYGVLNSIVKLHNKNGVESNGYFDDAADIVTFFFDCSYCG